MKGNLFYFDVIFINFDYFFYYRYRNCLDLGVPETGLLQESSNTSILNQIIYANEVVKNHEGIVCDNRGNENSISSLWKYYNSGTKPPVSLAYPGPCLGCCSLFGPVCGRDGRNYHSECVAHSYRVGVDHSSSCSNETWKCSPIPSGCQTSSIQHVPGTRCSFCGSVTYFTITPFMSNILPTKDRYDFIQKYSHKLTISSIVQRFHQISTINCQILAHKPIENILAVSFTPEYSDDSAIFKSRTKACELEMRRIETLFVKRSPRIVLWFPLNLLHYDENFDIESYLRQNLTKTNNLSNFITFYNSNLLIFLIFVYIFYYLI